MGTTMIWTGAGVTLLGLIGLIGCVIYGVRLRNAGLPDAEFRQKLKRGVMWNMIALFVSVIGLMLVIMGIALG